MSGKRVCERRVVSPGARASDAQERTRRAPIASRAAASAHPALRHLSPPDLAPQQLHVVQRTLNASVRVVDVIVDIVVRGTAIRRVAAATTDSLLPVLATARVGIEGSADLRPVALTS